MTEELESTPEVHEQIDRHANRIVKLFGGVCIISGGLLELSALTSSTGLSTEMFCTGYTGAVLLAAGTVLTLMRIPGDDNGETM